MLTENQMPFCPGCGYHLSTRVLAKAVEKAGLQPLDVVLVSDIGCCGLIDGLLTCHTVHGLHGRSCALAFGIAQGLAKSGKKVLAFQGDGGVTIGLQHLLEAARRNVDVTLLVHNNMVYGMTGGQVSGLSPEEVKKIKMPEESEIPPFNICELAHQAGAAFSYRIIERGDYSDVLAEAIRTPGFSLLEIVGPCPVHGLAKVKEISEVALEEVKLKNHRKPIAVKQQQLPSLLTEIQDVQVEFDSPLQSRLSLIIAGSAGGGVQSAAELLASAAVSSALQATKKGDYPVTVGTGFSVAEVILSREEIHYTGIRAPDVAIIVSEDGLNMAKNRVGKSTKIIIDESLSWETTLPTTTGNFRRLAGSKGAALCAIAFWLAQEKVLPVGALVAAAQKHKHADKLVRAIEKAAEVVDTALVHNRVD